MLLVDLNFIRIYPNNRKKKKKKINLSFKNGNRLSNIPNSADTRNSRNLLQNRTPTNFTIPSPLVPTPTERIAPRLILESACIMNVCHIRQLISVDRCQAKTFARRRPDCVIDFQCLLSELRSIAIDGLKQLHRSHIADF